MKKHSNKKNSGRNLIIFDIENYVGKGELTKQDAMSAKTKIEHDYNIGPNDLVLIGTSHQSNFVNAKLAWPGAQHCYKPGHNGADIALIEAAEVQLRNSETFSEVILLSGDGIFTRLMKKIRNLGIKGTVVSLANQINKNLAYASTSLLLVAPIAQAA